MQTRRRKLLEACFGRWSTGKMRAVFTAAALLGLAYAAHPADAISPGYGGCGGYERVGEIHLTAWVAHPSNKITIGRGEADFLFAEDPHVGSQTGAASRRT